MRFLIVAPSSLCGRVTVCSNKESAETSFRIIDLLVSVTSIPGKIYHCSHKLPGSTLSIFQVAGISKRLLLSRHYDAPEQTIRVVLD